MPKLLLTPVGNQPGDSSWTLDLGEEAVVLLDVNSHVILSFARSDSHLHIVLPNGWLEIEHLKLRQLKTGGSDLEFRADKQVVAVIRAYLHETLLKDPEARRKYKEMSTRTLLMGAVLTTISLALVLFMWGIADHCLLRIELLVHHVLLGFQPRELCRRSTTA